MAKITMQRLKPRIVTGGTKAETVRSSLGGIYSRTHFSIRGNREQPIRCNIREGIRKGEEVAVLFNLHKVRRKTKRVTVVGKRSVKKTTELVRNNHWIAYVYEVPLRIVKMAVQNDRNFELVIGA